MFIYCELRVGRGIPGDAPVRPAMPPFVLAHLCVGAPRICGYRIYSESHLS